MYCILWTDHAMLIFNYIGDIYTLYAFEELKIQELK